MAKVKLKKPDQSPPTTAPIIEAGCRRCRSWISRHEKLRAVDPSKLHAKVCVPGTAAVEERRSQYFSLTDGEIKERETERLLTLLLNGLSDSETSAKVEIAQNRPESTNAAPTQVRPSVAPKASENARQGPQTGCDVFGFKANSGAAAVNRGLGANWKTVAQIVKDGKVGRQPHGQLQKMVEIGFAEKRGDKATAEFRLNQKAINLLKENK